MQAEYEDGNLWNWGQELVKEWEPNDMGLDKDIMNGHEDNGFDDMPNDVDGEGGKKEREIREREKEGFGVRGNHKKQRL